MYNLDDSIRGGTCCLDAAGLAEGTNDSTIQTANAIDFAIDGYLYTKALTDNIATTVCAEQALGTTCIYLVSVIADGTITVTKGVEVASADVTAGTAVVQFPVLPADSAPVGKIKITTGTTAFTVGVDDLTTDIGTGAVAYADLFAVPTKPETTNAS
jgi:hypothetical protein